MSGFKLIDPAHPSSWPTDVTDYISGLAKRVLDVAGNGPHRPTVEMRLETYEDEPVELELRSLLGDRRVAMAHATRILPHELAAIEREGIRPLSVEHRSSRLDDVIARFGTEPGVPDFEPLRFTWPLSDPAQSSGRVGLLWAVSPLCAAFADDPGGLTPLLDTWGGETFARAPTADPSLGEAVEWLTSRSIPAVIEVGVVASSIRAYQRLWPLLVAHHLGWSHLWQEYASTERIGPDCVTVITLKSPRWPLF